MQPMDRERTNSKDEDLFYSAMAGDYFWPTQDADSQELLIAHMPVIAAGSVRNLNYFNNRKFADAYVSKEWSILH